MTVAGNLDRRVQFRRAALVDTGLSKSEVFEDFGWPVWASKVDVSDGERLRAAEQQANISARFRVRWSPFVAGITPKDRLVCDGVDYDISGLKEIGRREFREITANARSDR